MRRHCLGGLKMNYRKSIFQQGVFIFGPAIMIAIIFVYTSVPRITNLVASSAGESTSKPKSKLWPEEDEGDRILYQLAYVPAKLLEITQNGTKLKTILLHNASRLWIDNTHPGRQTFLEDNCSVNTCSIISNYSEFQNVDAVIFTADSALPKEGHQNEEQIWILYILESPANTPHLTHKPVFNWTVTYRRDSEVSNPYKKFILDDPSVTFKHQRINYAANKTKKVAWFASNCRAANKRLEYVNKLSKHISVDHYGTCIPTNRHSCPRAKQHECSMMLKKDYKFYLSFENSNCKHYITEKFFVNALGNDILPIVMGARKEDYERAAPYHSFIHVDDFESPKALAEYLHELDKNDTLYNEYFQWKGTGKFSHSLNSHFWCRLCAMLHSDIPKKVYSNVEKWWRGPGTCTEVTWRNNT